MNVVIGSYPECQMFGANGRFVGVSGPRRKSPSSEV